MDMLSRNPSNQALQLPWALVLAGALLLPGQTRGQSIPTEHPPEDPRSPQIEDTRDPGDECEDHDDDGDCDPVSAALGVVIVEYLPQLTDGVRMGYGRTLGGSAYGGRLEWTLHKSQGRRLMLGAGTWIAPTKMLQPGMDDQSLQPSGRDGAFSLTLGGSAPLEDLGFPAGRSFQGVAETTVLVGDPSRQLRLAVGPRYRVDLDQKALMVDLVVGTNLSAESFAPRVGLCIGWTWD